MMKNYTERGETTPVASRSTDRSGAFTTITRDIRSVSLRVQAMRDLLQETQDRIWGPLPVKDGTAATLGHSTQGELDELYASMAQLQTLLDGLEPVVERFATQL